jgi:hypothetical protein
MDPLFLQLTSSEQRLLVSLARAQESLDRVLRRRRRIVSAMALTGLLCLLAARGGIGWFRWSCFPFTLLALMTISAYFVERRQTRRRDALLARLPLPLRLRLGSMQ